MPSTYAHRRFGPDGFVQMLDSVFNVPPLFDDSYYGGIIQDRKSVV